MFWHKSVAMALPPPFRPWLTVVCVLPVLMDQIPGVLQKCIYDEVQAEVRKVRLEPATSQGRGFYSQRLETNPRVGASPQPIRIHTWITRESDNLPEAERRRVMMAVEEGVDKVSSLLSVPRIVGPLLLSRDISKYCKFVWSNSGGANSDRCGRANVNYRNETCLDVTIPDQHLSGCYIYPQPDSPYRTVLRAEGSGVSDTDFLLYLHIGSTHKCRAEPDVWAYAAHCQTDTDGRPVAAVVVICRDRLTQQTYKHQATVQMVIHELFHVLGFSKDLFPTWTDCSTSTHGGAKCSPQKTVVRPDGSGQLRIFSPSVISVLQKHLRSSEPELGGLLENLHVSPGRGSSHWEALLLQGSIMTAVLEESSTVRIDPLTLAAFQDTGWYSVDLGRAQNLVWGQGEGAQFGSVSSCQNRTSAFFCSGSGLGCHFLHLHKGECQTDPYLEGCRIYKPLKNSSECWKKENSVRSPGDKLRVEVWGRDSRCFFSNLSRHTHFPVDSSSVGGQCYRHRCTGPNSYQIQVSGSDWVDCPAGGTVQISGYQGVVFCPDRRLCLYPDVTPPGDDEDTASHTSPVQGGTWSTPLTNLTMVSVVILLLL